MFRDYKVINTLVSRLFLPAIKLIRVLLSSVMEVQTEVRIDPDPEIVVHH